MPKIEGHSQPRLQTMFQEYSLLAFGPVNDISQKHNMRLFAVGYGVEVVQEGSDHTIIKIKIDGRIYDS